MAMLEFAITGPDAEQAADALEALLVRIGDGSQSERLVLQERQGTGEKALTPMNVAIATLLITIPSALLSSVDLVDRMNKRPKAEEVIALAKQLTVNGNVTINVTVNGSGVPMPAASLTPDQLLELAGKTAPSAPSHAGRKHTGGGLKSAPGKTPGKKDTGRR